jgi:branched-chain amino acid aminotransferase
MENNPHFLININGQFFNENEAKISVLDRGFLYGDSVYETTRTFDRKPFRIDQHLDRLFESASKLEFTPRLSKAEIKNQISKTIEHSEFNNLMLRIVLTRGTNADLGLSPDLSSSDNLIIYAKEIKPQPERLYTEGVKVISYKKKTSTLGSYAKSASYQENVMAMKKAHENQAYEAIMINENDRVTEASTSNLWLIKDGMIKTPVVSEGLLLGLTRKTLLEICRKYNFNHQEVTLTLKDFLEADEVFLTSTNRDLVPIVQVDKTVISNGKPGQKTLELLNLYRQFVKSN